MESSTRNTIGFTLFGFLMYTIWFTSAMRAFNALSGSQTSTLPNQTSNHANYSSGPFNTNSVHYRFDTEKAFEQRYEKFCGTKLNILTALFGLTAVGRFFYPFILLQVPITVRMVFSMCCYIVATILISSSSNMVVVIIGTIFNGLGFGIGLTTILLLTKHYGGDIAIGGLGYGNALVGVCCLFDGTLADTVPGLVTFNFIGVALIALSYFKIIQRVPDSDIRLVAMRHPDSRNPYPHTMNPKQSNRDDSLNITVDENRKLLHTPFSSATILYNTTNLDHTDIRDISETLTLRQKYELLPSVAWVALFGLLQYAGDYYVVDIYPLIYYENLANNLKLIGLAVAMATFQFVRIRKEKVHLVALSTLLMALVFLLHILGLFPNPGIVGGGIMLFFQGATTAIYYLNSYSDLNHYYDERYLAFAGAVLSNATSFGAALSLVFSELTKLAIC